MSPFTFPLQINWNSSLQLQFYWRTVIFGKSKSRTFSQRKVFRHKLRISSCSRIYGNYFGSRKIWKIFLILSFFLQLKKKKSKYFWGYASRKFVSFLFQCFFFSIWIFIFSASFLFWIFILQIGTISSFSCSLQNSQPLYTLKNTFLVFSLKIHISDLASILCQKK